VQPLLAIFLSVVVLASLLLAFHRPVEVQLARLIGAAILSFGLVLLVQDMDVTAGCEQTSLKSCFRDDDRLQPSTHEVQRHCSASETLLSAVLGSNILFPTTNHPRSGLGPPSVWAWNWPPLADSIRRELNLRPFEITFSSRLPCKQYGCEAHECLKAIPQPLP
jgi:hypothetical protein